VSRLPSLTFTISGVDFVLTGKDLVMEVSSAGTSICISTIIGLDLPGHPDYMILGDVFLRRYYSEFDGVNKRVGFAPAVPSSRLNSTRV